MAQLVATAQSEGDGRQEHAGLSPCCLLSELFRSSPRSRNHGSLVKRLDSGRANLRLILGLSSNA
jgi:hypothetical protein